MGTPKPVVLCILDGWGLRDDREGNAPSLADTPAYDRIMATSPKATLVTFGPDVGLPKGQMGNSEVGHTNIGAGRVVAMDLGQIDLAIEEGSFFDRPALVAFAETVKAAGGTVHLAGLASPGGVHSHQRHIVAAAKAMSDRGLPVVVHAITDGRDVPPRSAAGQLATLETDLPDGVRIATVIGRYFAMDRDNRWPRVQKAFDLIVRGRGSPALNASDVARASYEAGVSDEFIEPAVLDEYQGMKDGDGIFFVNFRADRAREILAAIGAPDFDAFETGPRPKLSAMLGMAEYSDQHNAYMQTVFPKEDIVNTLGAWIASKGLRQFRVAETEKYPHVTFFLNGGREDPELGEDRVMPKSPDVATYDLKPEMSADEVTDRLVEAIRADYDLIVVNYANPDMVGHTGDLGAAIRACEAVDKGLARVVEALRDVGGALVLTADHGNCETMIDPDTGGPHTAHTTNLVPAAVVGYPEAITLDNGRLADIAPTILDMMGLPKPPEMTGRSLIRR